MEVLFENTHTRDRQTMKEVYGKLFLRNPIWIIFDVYMGLLTLWMIGISILSGDLNLYFWVCIIFYILIRITGYYRSVRRSMQGDAEVSGGDPIRVVSTVTDSTIITATSTGSRNELPLSNVKYVSQTKNLILVCTKAKFTWVFHKEGFSKGSAMEFLCFLADKKIKIKK